jgi:hypothetical protein
MINHLAKHAANNRDNAGTIAAFITADKSYKMCNGPLLGNTPCTHGLKGLPKVIRDKSNPDIPFFCCPLCIQIQPPAPRRPLPGILPPMSLKRTSWTDKSGTTITEGDGTITIVDISYLTGLLSLIGPAIMNPPEKALIRANMILSRLYSDAANGIEGAMFALYFFNIIVFHGPSPSSSDYESKGFNSRLMHDKMQAWEDEDYCRFIDLAIKRPARAKETANTDQPSTETLRRRAENYGIGAASDLVGSPGIAERGPETLEKIRAQYPDAAPVLLDKTIQSIFHACNIAHDRQTPIAPHPSLPQGDLPMFRYRNALAVAYLEDYMNDNEFLPDPDRERVLVTINVLQRLMASHKISVPTNPNDEVPNQATMFTPESQDSKPFQLDPQSIRELLVKMSSRSSPGIMGITPRTLRRLFFSTEAGFRDALLLYYNRALRGEFSDDARMIFMTTTITPLNKIHPSKLKDGETMPVRPIACGSLDFRNVSRAACRSACDKVTEYLGPTQFGFNVKAGIDAEIHATRSILKTFTETRTTHDNIMLMADAQNAYGLTDRHLALANVDANFKSISPFLKMTYSQPSKGYYGPDSCTISRGVLQGDPCGGLVYCINHKLTVDMIMMLHRYVLALNYCDDMNVLGEAQAVYDAFNDIQIFGEVTGYKFNRNKTLVVRPGTEPVDPVNLPIHEEAFRSLNIPGSIESAPHGAVVLGTPVFANKSAESTTLLRSAVNDAISKVREVRTIMDYQMRYLILSQCRSTCLLMQLIRTVPPEFWEQELNDFDQACITALTECFDLAPLENGAPAALPDWVLAKVRLPPGLGGDNMQLTSHLRSAAFLGSKRDTRLLVHEILRWGVYSTRTHGDIQHDYRTSIRPAREEYEALLHSIPEEEEEKKLRLEEAADYTLDIVAPLNITHDVNQQPLDKPILTNKTQKWLTRRLNRFTSGLSKVGMPFLYTRHRENLDNGVFSAIPGTHGAKRLDFYNREFPIALQLRFGLEKDNACKGITKCPSVASSRYTDVHPNLHSYLSCNRWVITTRHTAVVTDIARALSNSKLHGSVVTVNTGQLVSVDPTPDPNGTFATTEGTKRGDIRINNANGSGVTRLLDVTLSDVMCPTHVNTDVEDIHDAAIKRKNDAYLAPCNAAGISFSPVPFTALGCPSKSSYAILSSLLGISDPRITDGRNTEWEEKRNYKRLTVAISGSCFSAAARNIIRHQDISKSCNNKDKDKNNSNIPRKSYRKKG